MAAAEVIAPPLKPYPVIPILQAGAMAHSKTYTASPAMQQALGFPGRAGRGLAGQGDRKAGRAAAQIPLAQGLSGRLRALRRLHRQMPLFSRYRRPEEHAGRAPGSAAQGLPPLFHLGGKVVSETGRRRRPDQGSARRLVHLFQPVLGVPPLLGVLPLRHRHRRDHHGRERDHGLDRHGAEILQRDHRQGAQGRQQPRPARAGAARHAAEHRGRPEGRDRPGHTPAAQRERRGSAAGHALGGFFRRAARLQPDRLRQGVPRGRHSVDAVHPRLGGGQLRPVHRQLRPDAENRDARARGGARPGGEAAGGGRVRPCLARRLQLLEHAHRPVRFSRSRTIRCRSTSAS